MKWLRELKNRFAGMVGRFSTTGMPLAEYRAVPPKKSFSVYVEMKFRGKGKPMKYPSGERE